MPAGWRATLGAKGSTTKVGDALNPLDAAVTLDVTPTTTVVHGIVTGGDGFPLDSVVIDVNGMTAMTDDLGRCIVDGGPVGKDSLYVEATRKSHSGADKTVAFAVNAPKRVDIRMEGSGDPVHCSGRVAASGWGAPIAGAEIRIDEDAIPTNKAKSGPDKGTLATGADGTFRAQWKAQDTTVSISARQPTAPFARKSLPLPATTRYASAPDGFGRASPRHGWRADSHPGAQVT